MCNWTNQDNAVFYEHYSDILKTWAEAGGLSTWPDLVAIESYIKPAKNILEIGSGYGRVLQYLMQHHHDKKISGVEKSHNLFETLALQFKESVTLYECDIAQFKMPKSYDLILWLWSGLTDFSQPEQPHIIKHIQQLLKPSATLIIETFPHDLTPSNGHNTANQSYELTYNNSALHGYIPSPDEMHNYALQAELHMEKIIEYETASNRRRKLYIYHSPFKMRT